MAYADLSETDVVLLAVEFFGRGQDIPGEIAARLGPDLIADITHPETHNEPTARRAGTSHK